MNAKPPFFSVVMPTKNRSHILRYAIQSILWQTFEDFEIILVDNSDTEETQTLVDQFNDSRIRYFRTGNLTMANNWDYGIKQASGEYITIVADKHVFRKKALSQIYQGIEQSSKNIITWKHTSFIRNGDNGYLESWAKEGDPFILSTEELVKYLLKDGRNNFRRFRRNLPRGYNSATHRSLVDKIISSLGFACTQITPDYTFGAAQIALEKEIFVMRTVLFATDPTISIGRSFRKKEDMKKHREDLGAKEDFYTFVPVKTDSLISNLIYNDVLNIREKLGGNLASHNLDIPAYFGVLYDEIQERAYRNHQDMTDELGEWQQSLKQQPNEIQQLVFNEQAEVDALYKPAPLFKRGRYWLKKLLRVRNSKPVTLEKKMFPNSLEAFNYEDNL